MDVIRHLVLILISISPIFASAEDTATRIFDESIKSLQIRLDGDDFAPAVAILNTTDRICIDFDCLAEDRDFFRYSLTHCSWDWKPSGLAESEFLDGFNEGEIEDYAFSSGTSVHYVHYKVCIPNADISPVISGNYLLKIYRQEFPDEPILQCRFMLSENTAPVSVQASTRTDIDFNKEHQQLSITVDTERAGVEDIYNDLKIVLNQNGCLFNERSLTHPLKVIGHKAMYEHDPKLIFGGGKEFRRFETVNEYIPGIGIYSIEYHNPYRYYILNQDTSRAAEPYQYDQTQHGRYFVHKQNAAFDSNTEADYGMVLFTLDMPDLPKDTPIFLEGEFTHHNLDENCRMRFNLETGKFEKILLLKQGAYNYQYIIPTLTNQNIIDGNDYQTSNEYNINVYTRKRGERYDRLIGSILINSNHTY